MDLRAEMQIDTLIRAMEHVILPAIDPADATAQEQGALVLATLRLIADRLPMTYRYDRDELSRYVTLAAALLEALDVEDVARRALAVAHAEGTDTLARAGAEPAELVERSRVLRAHVGDLAERVAGAGAECDTLRRLIFAAAREQTVRERKWLEPTGFDAAAADLPSLEAQLPAPHNKRTTPGGRP